jgi:hypothetical protein
LPTGHLAHDGGGNGGDFFKTWFGHTARDQLDEAKALTSRQASDVHIVNFLDAAGDHKTSSDGKVPVEVADYNRVAKKTSREKSCATGKLQLSSRIDMSALRNLPRAFIHEPGKENETIMFRVGLGIGRWRRGGDNELRTSIQAAARWWTR